MRLKRPTPIWLVSWPPTDGEASNVHQHRGSTLAGSTIHEQRAPSNSTFGNHHGESWKNREPRLRKSVCTRPLMTDSGESSPDAKHSAPRSLH